MSRKPLGKLRRSAPMVGIGKLGDCGLAAGESALAEGAVRERSLAGAELTGWFVPRGLGLDSLAIGEGAPTPAAPVTAAGTRGKSTSSKPEPFVLNVAPGSAGAVTEVGAETIGCLAAGGAFSQAKGTASNETTANRRISFGLPEIASWHERRREAPPF